MDTTFDLAALQEHLGLRFNQPELLQQALTHSSYAHEGVGVDVEDNERLEYLGDAILDFLTADMLYRRFPNMAEGELTRLRSALVRTEALAQLAVNCRLGEALITGKGEADSGGRERAHNLAGVFEALIGALYLDQGLAAVSEFVLPRLTELQKDVMDEAIRKNPRSRFQEWTQGVYGITPHFRTIAVTGLAHALTFTVEAVLGEQVVATGQGRTKRAAAQDAARHALDKRDHGELTITAPDVESNNEQPHQSEP